MAIPKKGKKKTLLKTSKEKEEVQQLVSRIETDEPFGYDGLRPIAKDFFIEYVRGGMTPKSAYSKMKQKMKTIKMDEIMSIISDSGPES